MQELDGQVGEATLAGVRGPVLDRSLRLAALGALPIYLFFVARMVQTGRLVDLAAVTVIYLAIAGLALGSRLGYGVRSKGLVGVLAGYAAFILAQQGYTPGAMVAGCAVPLLAVLFLGVREALGLLALWGLAIAGVGRAMELGLLGLPEEVLLTQRYPNRWFAVLLVQLALLLPVLLATNAVLARLRREILEKQAALEDLARAQASMLEGERVRTLGLLAGSVAHDLNNTLTVITAEADMLEGGNVEGREAILEAAASAAGMSRQLLNVAGRSMSRVRAMALQSAVRPSIRMMERLLPATIRLTADLDDRLWVMADAALLQQAVLNLVINARDAMPGGGQIRISAARAPEPEAGAFAVLAVSDDGPGMPPEVKARAFEPFFTTKGEKGTGLGLASVRKTLESAGGRVELESEPGRGTRVALWLPTASEVPSAPATEAEPGGERVLLVEPDIRVRAVMFGVLRNANYLVTEVGTLAGAEAALAEAPGHQALVADLDLPDGFGLLLARQFTQQRPGAAVLVLSGFIPREEDRIALSAGEFRFLAKPFTAAELRAELRRALQEGKSPRA